MARLNEDFMIEYTYNSNAIEGNTLTLRETDMVLKGLTIDQKPLKDHMEAVGHKEAFYFICDLVGYFFSFLKNQKLFFAKRCRIFLCNPMLPHAIN